MRHRLELNIRFIEADMCILADAEHLQIDPSGPADPLIVAPSLRGQILRHAVGYKAARRIQVNP